MCVRVCVCACVVINEGGIIHYIRRREGGKEGGLFVCFFCRGRKINFLLEGVALCICTFFGASEKNIKKSCVAWAMGMTREGMWREGGERTL